MHILWTILVPFGYFLCPIQTHQQNVCTENQLVEYTDYHRRTRYVPYQHRNWLGFYKTKYRLESYNEPTVISLHQILYSKLVKYV